MNNGSAGKQARPAGVGLRPLMERDQPVRGPNKPDAAIQKGQERSTCPQDGNKARAMDEAQERKERRERSGRSRGRQARI